MRAVSRILIAAALASCAGTGRLDIEIENRTDAPLILRAHAFFLSRSIEIPAGETWCGWISAGAPSFGGAKIIIEEAPR